MLSIYTAGVTENCSLRCILSTTFLYLQNAIVHYYIEIIITITDAHNMMVTYIDCVVQYTHLHCTSLTRTIKLVGIYDIRYEVKSKILKTTIKIKYHMTE